jgi:hypothetical protein
VRSDRSRPEKHFEDLCGSDNKSRRIYELSPSTPELFTETASELLSPTTEASLSPQELPSPVPMAFKGFEHKVQFVELPGDNTFYRNMYTNHELPQRYTARHRASTQWGYPAHTSPLSLATTLQFRPPLRIEKQAWALPDRSNSSHSQASTQVSPATSTSSNDTRHVMTAQQSYESPIDKTTSPQGLLICNLSRGRFPPTNHVSCQSQWRAPKASTGTTIEPTTSHTSMTGSGLYVNANNYSCYPPESSASTEPPPPYSTASREVLHSTTHAEHHISSWPGLEDSNANDLAFDDNSWWLRNQSRSDHGSERSVEPLPSEGCDQSQSLQGLIESMENVQEYASHDHQAHKFVCDSHEVSNVRNSGPPPDRFCKLCDTKFTGQYVH